MGKPWWFVHRNKGKACGGQREAPVESRIPLHASSTGSVRKDSNKANKERCRVSALAGSC